MFCGKSVCPQKFDGTSDNLDSFFVQFHIACQLNKWPENQKAFWLGQCLEGLALLYSNGLLQHETFCQPATFDILQQALYQRFEHSLLSYIEAFYKRKLFEGETVTAYGWDLKRLALKAYPYQLIQDLQPLLIEQFIYGLGIKGWSNHVLFYCPQSINEAIEIAIGKKTFNDCHYCLQQESSTIVHDNSYSYKLTRHVNKTKRFKPYSRNSTRVKSVSISDIHSEHKQLQTSVPLEDHYTCDLVEVVVEIPCSNISHGDSAQLQSSNASDVPFDANDMSHCGSLKNNDVLPLDIERTELKGYHVSCIQNTFCHYMSVKQEFSCYTSFQPSVLFKTAYKPVVNLKHRIHDNSRGDYYPNIELLLCMVKWSCIKQTRGYVIRCWKRDFPD